MGKVLDMTDWSLFFSKESGYVLKDVYGATADPDTRWVIARNVHLQGRWRYSRILRDLIQGRAPVMSFPADPKPGQLQVQVYDRWTPLPADALARQPRPAEPDHRAR
jgi:hypothetical protein